MSERPCRGDSLKDQRQGEAGLQLDNDGRFPVADRDQIAAVDFSLHGIALRFEESLYRGIEGVFAHGLESTMKSLA